MLAGVVGPEVEGREIVEAPRGIRISFRLEAIGELLRQPRDLLRRAKSGKCGGCNLVHSGAIEDRCEGPVELQVELAIAGVLDEHASTVSPVYVRWAAQ